MTPQRKLAKIWLALRALRDHELDQHEAADHITTAMEAVSNAIYTIDRFFNERT